MVYTLNAYQQDAVRTRQKWHDEGLEMAFGALEIAAESGEIANVVYKHLFQGHQLDKSKLLEELGDILWGVAVLAYSSGYSLEQVANYNTTKLRKRYPNGFTVEDSLERRDHAGSDDNGSGAEGDGRERQVSDSTETASGISTGI